MTGLDEMKKYIRPSYVSLYIGAALLLLGIFFATKTNPAVFLLFAMIAVISNLFPISEIIKFNKTMQQLTENGTIERIAEEFQQAKEYADGNLKLGSAHIYGKRSGTVLEYKDIAKAYQYIHKTNFAEDRRELRVATQDGKTISLCKLALRGKADEALMTIIQVMLSHNPGIKIGYN